MYASPPGARVALAAHHDSHDVLAVQVCGRKRWTLWVPPRAALLKLAPAGWLMSEKLDGMRGWWDGATRTLFTRNAKVIHAPPF